MRLRALNALRHSPACRRESFDAGLTAAGFELVDKLARPGPGDVYLIWNRYTGTHETATAVEAAGGRVLIAENGLLGKEWRGQIWFALAESHHAGAGRWREGGPERWDGWKVEMAAWRHGGETVIFGQRGYGEPNVRAPDLWAESAKGRFGGRIRAHPGTAKNGPTLEQDLAKAGQVLTWNSGAALKALLLGVPVWYEFDQWVGARAALPFSVWGAEPKRDDADRLAMFRRLAWAMWTEDEIASGAAIRSALAL